MSIHDLGVAERFRIFRKKFVDNNVNIAGPLLGVSKAKINRIENGVVALDVKILKLLKSKYNLNQTWLLDNTGNMQVKDKSVKTGLKTSMEMGDRIDELTTQVKILTKNLYRAWEIIERHEKEINRLEGKK